MDIDFLEIGTSNFDTLIQTCDDSETGISVDAIKYYLDCLPNKPNIKKIHTAITSDRTSDSIDIYYIPEDIIISNNLYDWFKGCNTIGDFHPLHKSHNITHLVKIEKAPLVNIDEFLTDNNIRKIKYLKIDTEGHDCVILNGLFNYLQTKSKEYYPDNILFESNTNISDQEITNTIYHGIDIGYTLISRGYDTILQLL
jgi:hypothetical protein